MPEHLQPQLADALIRRIENHQTDEQAVLDTLSLLGRLELDNPKVFAILAKMILNDPRVRITLNIIQAFWKA